VDRKKAARSGGFFNSEFGMRNSELRGEKACAYSDLPRFGNGKLFGFCRVGVALCGDPFFCQKQSVSAEFKPHQSRLTA
jgi:hypothetical protein